MDCSAILNQSIGGCDSLAFATGYWAVFAKTFVGVAGDIIFLVISFHLSPHARPNYHRAATRFSAIISCLASLTSSSSSNSAR